LIHECPLHCKNGKWWVAFPARSYEGKDGIQQWKPLLEFSEASEVSTPSKDLRTAVTFSRRLVSTALRYCKAAIIAPTTAANPVAKAARFFKSSGERVRSCIGLCSHSTAVSITHPQAERTYGHVPRVLNLPSAPTLLPAKIIMLGGFVRVAWP